VWKWSFWAFFVATMLKLQQFVINKPDKVCHRQRAAIQLVAPVATSIRSTLWHQPYVTTSKEYLTISHILSKYFDLVFLQLHLVKMLCKLIIIWLNYERKKKGPFYETPCTLVSLIYGCHYLWQGTIPDSNFVSWSEQTVHNGRSHRSKTEKSNFQWCRHNSLWPNTLRHCWWQYVWHELYCTDINYMK